MCPSFMCSHLWWQLHFPGYQLDCVLVCDWEWHNVYHVWTSRWMDWHWDIHFWWYKSTCSQFATRTNWYTTLTITSIMYTHIYIVYCTHIYVRISIADYLVCFWWSNIWLATHGGYLLWTCMDVTIFLTCPFLLVMRCKLLLLSSLLTAVDYCHLCPRKFLLWWVSVCSTNTLCCCCMPLTHHLHRPLSCGNGRQWCYLLLVFCVFTVPLQLSKQYGGTSSRWRSGRSSAEQTSRSCD